MNQAEQPANAADPSRGAKRGAKPKACDTCRPLKTKCAPREGTCGRCIRMGIDCVRSHVQLQQASESAASESSSQQSAEGDDHSAEPVGAETVPQQSQEATLIADSTDPEIRSNHQEPMDLSLDPTDAETVPQNSSQEGTDQSYKPFDHKAILQRIRELYAQPFDSMTDRIFQSVDRGSTPPLSYEDMDQSSNIDDSRTDSEQSDIDALRTTETSFTATTDKCRYRVTTSLSRDSSGTIVCISKLQAITFLWSEWPEVSKGYLAANDDDIVATLFGRQFSNPLQEFGYRLRRREPGYKLLSNLIIDNFARSFNSIYDQDVRPSLFSLFFSCKQQPVVPEQIWICIKSDGNIPVGTVFETLPQQGQESQLKQVELDEVTGPDLQLIRKKLWEIYGSSI